MSGNLDVPFVWFLAFMISFLQFAPNDERLDLSVNDRDGRMFWPAPKTFQDMHCQGVLALSSFLLCFRSSFRRVSFFKSSVHVWLGFYVRNLP